MLQRVPGFSKDTMRAALCTLVFFFSLPWSLNGHLTTSNKNIAINAAENTSRQRDYTTDSATENVVSLSKGAHTRQLTSHSEHQEISLKTANSNDDKSRMRRNVHDKHDLTTMSTHPETQTQDKVNQQKELEKPTESSHTPHTTSLLQTENARELNVFAKPDDAKSAAASPEQASSSGLSETQKATQETPSISTITRLYNAQSNKTVMDSNKTNTNKDLPTAQPTMEISDQPSPMTHAHTSAKPTVTYSSGTLSTNGVKTTKVKEVTERWTSTQSTQSLELRSSMKPTKMTTTTRKNAKKPSPPSSKDKQQANPGPAVAAVIVTTFVLMFIAIIFILVKKRKMQRKQLENPEWAGPSPFLDGDVQPNLPNTEEFEAINRKGSNQSAFSRYVSQRLSKHLTFGRNTSEEVLMGDILQGSTFGRQNPDEVQAPNGNPTAAQASAETEGNQIEEGQESADSSDAKAPASGSKQQAESKESKQTDDLTAATPSGPNTVVKTPPHLVSIDLDSLSEEAAALQTSDGGIIPPAPPLP